jgi:aminoglycoside phosphotransferase (APT) family kinase protein
LALANEGQKFELVAQKLEPHSKLLRTWELKGGISAQMMALEILQADGQVRKIVVRRHGWRDLEHNKQVAEHEFKLLQRLQAMGVPVPTPYYVDQSGEIFPTPYVVMEFIEGATEFAPENLADFLRQFAMQLSQIHQIRQAKLDASWLSQLQDLYGNHLLKRPAVLDDSLDEGRIRDALELVWPFPQRNASVLLHGDFWPGNVMWKAGRLVAVVDWEDAALGDPLADLAISRLDMLWFLGYEAMQRLTEEYQSMMPLDYSNLPYWDLCVALRPAGRLSEWAEGDARREKQMREGHRLFVAQAFERL